MAENPMDPSKVWQKVTWHGRNVKGPIRGMAEHDVAWQKGNVPILHDKKSKACTCFYFFFWPNYRKIQKILSKFGQVWPNYRKISQFDWLSKKLFYSQNKKKNTTLIIAIIGIKIRIRINIDQERIFCGIYYERTHNF
jgi:hypothetical protein